ncbi:MAG: glycoside hydrolase family protein [Bacteroidota bacterium]
MKGLLFLLMLFPAVLFGQKRHQAIIDSIRAAAPNLQRVSKLLNNYPHTRVEDIQVSDSDDYVTLVVRVRVAGMEVIPSLRPAAVLKLKTVIAANDSRVVAVPALPLIAVADTIKPLRVLVTATLPLPGIPLAIVKTMAVPSLPELEPETGALPLLAATQFKTVNGISTFSPAPVPPLPNFAGESIEALPVYAVAEFAVTSPAPGKMDTVVVPGLKENRLPVAEMHLSAEGYTLLEKMEGFSPDLYNLKDGGFTIGFGFFVPYGEGSKWNKGITWEEAERMIRQKMPVYEDQVKQYINVPLTQEEFDALTMLAYNLGGFSRATSIVNDINSGADFDKLQHDWMRFVHSKAPNVMKGLINRRNDELQVRIESNYQPERKIHVLKRK